MLMTTTPSKKREKTFVSLFAGRLLRARKGKAPTPAPAGVVSRSSAPSQNFHDEIRARRVQTRASCARCPFGRAALASPKAESSS